MILAICGPDCSGKTTLFDELQRVLPGRYLPRQGTLPRGLMPYMHHWELSHLALWELMYDPHLTYVCDRSFFVSGPVYAKLYNRPVLEFNVKWYSEVRVAYLDVPTEELRQRHIVCREQAFAIRDYDTVKRLYIEHLHNFKHIVLDGMSPTENLVEGVLSWNGLNS